MSAVHKTATAGFGTGTNEAYDRYRPTYPEEQLDYIQAALSSPSGPLNVLEPASGTGIFTRCLLAHKTLGPAVDSLRAVEPSAGMRARFGETTTDSRITCSAGTFDNTGIEDGWADLVVIAQAWHWCPDHETALTEIARVLKPEGILVLIWNLGDLETTWVGQVRGLCEPYDEGAPQYRKGTWRQMFDTRTFKDLYKQPQEEREITWIFPVTEDAVVNSTFTTSYIAILPDDEKATLRKEVQAVVERGDGRRWIDESKGIFEFPHKNLVVVLKKK
ncbi:hypothetical protein FRB96_001014 [Tulasnella sp. 330]|nr:hypothetical protein FRB96_001014 [Tulasnella sp. 330]KAG8881097.1 hypothetical protein FRB98_004554 [Tulasnella sp. 332]